MRLVLDARKLVETVIVGKLAHADGHGLLLRLSARICGVGDAIGV
jgi:hypothetical protein